jgi:putative transposase
LDKKTIKADRIPPLYHEVSEPTGIDLGVSTFATLSDGTVYQLPYSLKKAKIKLGKLQYRNRNKQLGNRKLGIKASKNAQKFYRNQAKKHADIAQRATRFLAENNDRNQSEVCSHPHRRFKYLWDGGKSQTGFFSCRLRIL